MKKTIGIAIIILVLGTSYVRAQEFSLHVKCYISDTLYWHPVIFGYDSAATDSYDGAKWFSSEFLGGEQEYPPPGVGQNLDFQMGGQALNRVYYGPIDIRKKPTASSFQLQFEIDLLANDATSAKLQWDKSLIPPIIHHIYLNSSYFPSKPRLDMKQTSEFVLPLKDSSGLYNLDGRMILTILYNMDSLDVRNPQMKERKAEIFPTVIASGKQIQLWLDESRPVTVQISDMIGHRMYSGSFDAIAGANRIPAGKLGHGMYFIDVQQSSSGTVLCRQKLIIE
jgi:hypothetical protein